MHTLLVGHSLFISVILNSETREQRNADTCAASLSIHLTACKMSADFTQQRYSKFCSLHIYILAPKSLRIRRWNHVMYCLCSLSLARYE